MKFSDKIVPDNVTTIRTEAMTIAQEIGVRTPQSYLPKPSIDLHKWAVIACDQFTSEPEYWQRVEEIVGECPSTFQMILPEVYLGTAQEKKRIESTHQVMGDYLQSGIFRQVDDFILVKKKKSGCM